jgi:YidC/Oxa1 family membrane protein insertase
MSVLDPFSHVLATVLAAAHDGLSALGADPTSGVTWALAIAAVVIAARAALLPLVLHGRARLGCLPLLLQVPVWLALYHLLDQVAAGTSVGAMTPTLVASLGAATLLGVPLADRGYLGIGPTHLVVVAGLALLAAGFGYVTQRYVAPPLVLTEGVPQAMATVQHWMPTVSAVSLLFAGGFVPVALLVYWVCNSGWTLGQSALLTRASTAR